MNRWISLCLGSIAGGVSRYALGTLIQRSTEGDFPYGTLAINLSGCFLIGFFNALAEIKFLISPNARLLLMTGFCGAFTTFSTLILETSNLFKDGAPAKALLNVLVSFLLGLALFYLGQLTAEIF